MWWKKEYTLQSEYDEMLANPNAFVVKKIMAAHHHGDGTFKPIIPDRRDDSPAPVISPLHLPFANTGR